MSSCSFHLEKLLELGVNKAVISGWMSSDILNLVLAKLLASSWPFEIEWCLLTCTCTYAGVTKGEP